MSPAPLPALLGTVTDDAHIDDQLFLRARLVDLCFNRAFDASPAGVWHAPTTLLLLGGRPQGLSLSLATHWRAMVGASTRQDRTLRIHLLGSGDETAELSLDDPGADVAAPPEAVAIARVLRGLARHQKLTCGIDLLRATDVPTGVGLGVEAAVRAATARAVIGLSGAQPGSAAAPAEVAAILDEAWGASADHQVCLTAPEGFAALARPAAPGSPAGDRAGNGAGPGAGNVVRNQAGNGAGPGAGNEAGTVVRNQAGNEAGNTSRPEAGNGAGPGAGNVVRNQAGIGAGPGARLELPRVRFDPAQHHFRLMLVTLRDPPGTPPPAVWDPPETEDALAAEGFQLLNAPGNQPAGALSVRLGVLLDVSHTAGLSQRGPVRSDGVVAAARGAGALGARALSSRAILAAVATEDLGSVRQAILAYCRARPETSLGARFLTTAGVAGAGQGAGAVEEAQR